MSYREKLVVKDLYAEKFELLRPSWDDFVVPLALASRRGNSDPTWTQLGTSGLYLQGFSAAADNEVFFTLQTSHGAMIGNKYSDVYERPVDDLRNVLAPHVHWIPSTTNTGNCVWELTSWPSTRGTAYSDDDVQTSTITVAASGVVTEQINGFDDIDASAFKDSTCIVCRLRRLGSDEDDTFTGVALGVSVDFHMPIHRLGSQAEFGDQ